jgi:predicted ATPase/class 3 adenylate cyclase
LSELPTGTVTFMFTDVGGSTRLWEEHPDAMREALARHDALLRDGIEANGGRIFKSTGDGLGAVFVTADQALAAAVATQRALGTEPWGPIGELRIRIGLHTGVAELRGGDYFGPVMNRTARLMAVAHPGQVLCSQATADLVRDSFPQGVGLRELGRHQLRDLARPEALFQITHPDLEPDFPPLRSVTAFPGNLPTERTTLIGRTRELEVLGGLVEQHRLVTLTGVGGVGKTRLAVQLAAEVLDRFPDGAWLVPLASVRDPVLVPNAIAAALEVVEPPGRPIIDTLRDAIGSRRLLVVLDNCEHVLDASARVVDALLDTCGELHVVATSREALAVEGERIWPTPSLSLPTPDGASIEELAQADAIALFVDRAAAVRPDFSLTPANADAVARLCERLDGIPLAIELAAARVGALGPQDILERVDQRFLILTGGSRTALERHQTLQAAVDWSYELLDEREQRLFERLSVFAGGFTLDGARAVAADDGTSEVEVLQLLSGLVAKSMVIAEGVGASVRYRLLETLGQYGRDRLAGRDAPAVRERHARYYLAFAEALRPVILSPDQAAGLDRLSGEMDNVRAAFSWFLETGDAVAANRLIGNVGFFNDSGEMLRLRVAVLAVSESLPPPDLVDALGWAAWAAQGAGEHTRAREFAEASLAEARSAGMSPPSLSLGILGLVAFWQNDPDAAISSLEEGVEMARLADDGSRETTARRCSSLLNLGFVLGQAGFTERAEAVGGEAVDLARGLGVPSLLAAALFQYALGQQATDPARASELLDECLAQTVGGRWTYGRAWSLVAAGHVRAALDDAAGSLAAFGEALSLSRQTGERFIVPTALQGIARALRRCGRLAESARALGAAQALAERLEIPGGPADVAARGRAAARLQTLLGEEAFRAAWEAGRALSFDAAVVDGIRLTTGDRQDVALPDLSSDGDSGEGASPVVTGPTERA